MRARRHEEPVLQYAPHWRYRDTARPPAIYVQLRDDERPRHAR